jgi:hypothetical protein
MVGVLREIELGRRARPAESVEERLKRSLLLFPVGDVGSTATKALRRHCLDAADSINSCISVHESSGFLLCSSSVISSG